MATDRMGLLDELRKAAAEGDSDFLRAGVQALAEALMDAEVSERIGASHGERAPSAARPSATATASGAGIPA